MLQRSRLGAGSMLAAGAVLGEGREVPPGHLAAGVPASVRKELDGSSKGGVVLGICDELKVPVRYVGVGEKIGDLRPFDPAAFVEALYADASSGQA